MADKQITTEITAEDTGFASAMKHMRSEMAATHESMKGSLEGIQGVFEKLRGAFVAITAIIGGGKMFHESVEATRKMTAEANGLAKSMGITVVQASSLAEALQDVGGTSEQAVTAANRITRTMLTNEDAVKALGVATRDQTGHYRNNLDIMLDVNKALLEFRAGTDRNLEGMKIYGKQWNEIQPVLKLTADKMEEAEKRARALGTVVGQEDVAAAAKYKIAQREMNEVFEAMEKAVGDAVMPVLTQLAEELSAHGPEAVQAMKGAVTVLILAFDAVKLNITLAFMTLKTIVNEIVVSVVSGMRVVDKALHLDFKGAVNEWKNGLQQMKDLAVDHVKGVVDEIKKTGSSMADTWDAFANPKAKTAGTAQTGKAGTTEHDKSGDASNMQKWEAELAAAKVTYQEEHNLREMSRQEEIQYWQNILAKHTATEKEKVTISHKMSQLQLDIRKEKFSEELEALKAQGNAYQNNMDARMALATKEAELIKQRYGEDSKEYQTSQAQIIAIKRKAVEQQQQIEQNRAETARQLQLDQITLQEQTAQWQVSMGMMTETELLQQKRNFIQQRQTLEEQALQQRLELAKNDPDKNPVLLDQLEQQKAAIRAKYNAQLVANNQQLSTQISSPMMSISNTVQQQMTSMGSSIISNWRNVGSAVRNATMQIGTSIIQEVILKPLAAKAAAWIKERAITLAGIGGDAAKAGSGAASSQASIPYVGPILAVAAMAAIMAAVMANASKVPSARGGMDIPKGLNPLTQLHEEEMVLPKEPSALMRRLSAMEAAGELGGGNGGHTVHYHDYSGSLTDDQIERKSRAIADQLYKLQREGYRPRA